MPGNAGLHHPEDRGRGLVRGSCRAVARTDTLDLVEVARELGAGDGGRAFELEATPAPQHERRDATPLRQDCWHEPGRRELVETRAGPLREDDLGAGSIGAA